MGRSAFWNQKPTPLSCLVFQVGTPQQGKSRLFAIAEDIFETCDQVVAALVENIVQDRARDDLDYPAWEHGVEQECDSCRTATPRMCVRSSATPDLARRDLAPTGPVA